MFKQLTEDKLDVIAKMGEGISEILNSDEVSIITEENKPFMCDILPNEIGLDNFQVDSPIFRYKENSFECSLRKINLRRIHSLNKNFKKLNKSEQDVILNELLPILKKQFTHIYKIIEQRMQFVVDGYVYNHIDYLCRGRELPHAKAVWLPDSSRTTCESS